MPRRGAMWPTELSEDPVFRQLTALTQRLFQFVWLHADLNTGGFIAYQPRVWARAAADLSEVDIERSVDELMATGLALVDEDTGELWLRWFIRLDSSRKPNMYVNALRAIETARSRDLRRAAWAEVQELHPPPMERKGDQEAYDKRVADRERAFEQLRERMTERTVTATTARTVPATTARTVREPRGGGDGGFGGDGEHPAKPNLLCTNGCDQPAAAGEVACPACMERHALTGGLR